MPKGPALTGKQMIIVLDLEVDEGCDFCDKDAVTNWLAGILPTAGSRSVFGYEKSDPSYRYKDNTTYDTLNDLLADLGDAGKGPWSVLYETDEEIFQVGPFGSYDEAIENAGRLQAEQLSHKYEAGEGLYDINHQHVYLLGPDHRKVELTALDLNKKANPT